MIMSLSFVEYKNAASHKKKVKNLYLGAFPKEERVPFILLAAREKKNNGELLEIKDGDTFVGMVSVLRYKDLAYIFYLAIDDGLRGRGYGSSVLSVLKERYRGCRIFLAREQLDKDADNYEQRVSRHRFYQKNGLVDFPCKITEQGVIFDVMGIGDSVTAEEYDALITRWAGRFFRKLFDMHIIED